MTDGHENEAQSPCKNLQGRPICSPQKISISRACEACETKLGCVLSFLENANILLKFHTQFTWAWKIKYIIIISIDRASKEKKSLSAKKLTICPQKITIMKISIMYAHSSYIVQQKWPTELGIKKC